MAKKFRAQVELTAQDRASRSIQGVESRLTRLGRSMRLGVVAGAAAATAGLVALTRAIRSAVSAAQAQEDAVAKLNAALEPLGSGASAVSLALQEQATALQRVTKAGDETIIAGQALIASFTKNVDEIKAATQAALDLSAATGQNLNSAFLLLGRAASGETSTLSRYGITLDENIPKSEKFAAAIEKINEQFGGQAVAQAETFSGVIAQIGNAYGDLAEEAGFAVTENEKVRAALQDIRDVLLNQKTVEAVRSMSDALASIAVSAAGIGDAASDVDQLADRAASAARAAENLARGIVSIVSPIAAADRAIGSFIERLDPISGLLDMTRNVGEISRLRDEMREAQEDASGFSQKMSVVHAELLGMPVASQAAALGIERVGEAAEEAADSLDANVASVRSVAAAYEAAVGSAKAFGEVTSVQLESQVLSIITALEDQKRILGETSDEYVRLEAVATVKIGSLNARIQSLRDGLGDIETASDRASGSTGDLTQSFDSLAPSITRVRREANSTVRELDRLATSAERAARATSEFAPNAITGGESSFATIGGGTFTVAGGNQGVNFRTTNLA